MEMIPLEIIDLFFRFLHLDRDKRTLGTCSLVCAAWLPFARYRLLSDVTVKFSTHERDDVIEDLLSSPLCTIAPYICNLHIQGSCPALSPLSIRTSTAAIRSLPNIRNVTLQDITWPLMPVELKTAIASFDLTSLSFSFVFFATSQELYQLLSAFPTLTVLSLGYGVRWLGPSPDTHPSKPLKSVRRLSLDTSKAPLMSFLLQLTAPASIDALEMRFVSITQKMMVDEFLNRTTLKHLTLDFGKIGQGPGTIHFDLGSHPELRSLTLEGLVLSRSYYTSPEANWGACMALLSSIKSRSMESLTICLSKLHSVADVDWAAFDNVLEGEVFKNLKTVSLKCYILTDPDSQHFPHSDAIRAHLPKAHARDLLDFEYIPSNLYL
ncbi:hypothetical protein F5887DRAFT_968228 [Amanita rubescens]|nr:hypothetical protein F5887DRAFT_968228 [Amanita rubescens]